MARSRLQSYYRAVWPLVKASSASDSPRTGTFSMSLALETLGYRYVHHCLKYPADEEWARWQAAADAHFHRQRKGQDPQREEVKVPWSKAEWDAWMGQFQAVTDFAGVFAPQLISTYPGAKVILVIRPFERWLESISDTLLKCTYAWDYPLRRYILDPLCGGHSTEGLRTVFEGFFEADNPRDARTNARRRYDEHHELVRRMVPPNRLLEYRMGDGWEPLAKFLGKEIPLERFPHVNEKAWLLERGRGERRRKLMMAVTNLIKITSPLAFLALGYSLGGGSRLTNWRR
ncbi:uncharacterized protein PG998_014188 [Apiospora kogelbergensis]|uniref:uncharacterized protein n=1 Tax=Apiospora kogelbergensis TaxID=1337665 RepID=UPI00312FCBB2